MSDEIIGISFLVFIIFIFIKSLTRTERSTNKVHLNEVMEFKFTTKSGRTIKDPSKYKGKSDIYVIEFYPSKLPKMEAPKLWKSNGALKS